MLVEDKPPETKVTVRKTVYRRTLLGSLLALPLELIALPGALLSALDKLGEDSKEEEVKIYEKRID